MARSKQELISGMAMPHLIIVANEKGGQGRVEFLMKDRPS